MLAKQIYNIRVDNDLTQKELGNLIGLSQSIISRWENGDCEPGIYNIIGLCRALHIDPRMLFQDYLK